MVEEKKKLRAIHDLTFSGGGADERKAMWTGKREGTLEAEDRSLNIVMD